MRQAPRILWRRDFPDFGEVRPLAGFVRENVPKHGKLLLEWPQNEGLSRIVSDSTVLRWEKPKKTEKRPLSLVENPKLCQPLGVGVRVTRQILRVLAEIAGTGAS